MQTHLDFLSAYQLLPLQYDIPAEQTQAMGQMGWPGMPVLPAAAVLQSAFCRPSYSLAVSPGGYQTLIGQMIMLFTC